MREILPGQSMQLPGHKVSSFFPSKQNQFDLLFIFSDGALAVTVIRIIHVIYYLLALLIVVI
jgi:hypothetical protein